MRPAADLMPLLAFPGGYGGMVWSDQAGVASCCVRRDVLAACAPSRATSAPPTPCIATSSHLPRRARGHRRRHPRRPMARRRPDPARDPRRFADEIFSVGNVAGSCIRSSPKASMAMQSGWLLAGAEGWPHRSQSARRTRAGAADLLCRLAAAFRNPHPCRLELFALIAVQPASARAMTCGDQAGCRRR